MDEKLRPGRTGAVPIRRVNAVQTSSCFDLSLVAQYQESSKLYIALS